MSEVCFASMSLSKDKLDNTFSEHTENFEDWVLNYGHLPRDWPFLQVSRANNAHDPRFTFINGSFQFYDMLQPNSEYGPDYDIVNPFNIEFYQPSWYLSNPLREHFLNGNPMYLTVYQLMNDNDGYVAFCRPNSARKPFTGFTLDHTNKWILESVNPATMCAVSTVKEIAYERRNVIIASELVTHSPYGWGEETPVIPDDVNHQMDEFLAYFIPQFDFPDPMYVLDTCICDGKTKIVEVNALATSGLYDCDKGAIVKAVEDYVVREYHEDDFTF